MNLLYIADIRMPTEKAHGLQIMKTCEALAEAGMSVTLIVPQRTNLHLEDPFSYYRIKPVFTLHRMCTKEVFILGPIGHILSGFWLALASLCLIRINKPDVIYTRDMWPGLFFAVLRYRVVWEMHDARNYIAMNIFLRLVRGVIVISNGLKELLVRDFSMIPSKITVIRDAVDYQQFDVQETKFVARKKLSLPQDKKIVLYTGHLYEWKGVDVLAEASLYVNTTTLVVIVGGTEHDLEKFRNIHGENSHLLIVGRRPFEEMPFWQRAADILILPNSGKSPISTHYTSPMKLFEYLAAGKPIIASDLPSIREVVSDKEVEFVPSDNVSQLATTIEKLLADPERCARMSQSSQILSREYSWIMRAKKIIKFLELCLK